MLRSEHRRLVLEALADTTPPIRLGELAREVATRDDGLDPTDADVVNAVEISLHHRHLPKMDAFSVVRYDATEQRVTD